MTKKGGQGGFSIKKFTEFKLYITKNFFFFFLENLVYLYMYIEFSKIVARFINLFFHVFKFITHTQCIRREHAVVAKNEP